MEAHAHSAILFMAPPQPSPPIKITHDLWHLAFANLIQQCAPPNFEIQSEVRLSLEPRRADILLLRRRGVVRRDDAANVLRAVWPWLARITIVEFKSPIDSSFRPGDLVRLWSYGGQYQAAHMGKVRTRADLTLLLVVSSLTPTLHKEIARMGWTLVPLGGGYSRIDGAVYTLFVAVTTEVTVAENDDFLGLFSHRSVTNPEVYGWCRDWIKETTVNRNIKDMPGYDEMIHKLVEWMPAEKVMANYTPEQRLAGLPPEQRLAGLPPEQRLAGLPAEQRFADLTQEQLLLALPVETLRGLSADYLRSLPPAIEQAIRQRIARSDD